MSSLSHGPQDSYAFANVDDFKAFVNRTYGSAVGHDLVKAIEGLSQGQLEILQQFPIRLSKSAGFLSLDYPAKEIVIRTSVFELNDQALRSEMLGRLFLPHPLERVRVQQFLIKEQGETPLNEELLRKKYAVLCEGPTLLADIVRLADLKASDPALLQQVSEQAASLFGNLMSPANFFDDSFKAGNDSFIHRRRIALSFLQKSENFGEAALKQNPDVDATFGLFITNIQRVFGSLLGKKATIDPLGYLADRIQQRGRTSGIVPILEEAKILIRSGTAIDADKEPTSLSEWLIYRHNIDELRGLKELGEDEEIEFLEAIDESLRAKTRLFAPRRRAFERLVTVLASTKLDSLSNNLSLFLSETQDLGLLMLPDKGNALKLRTLALKMQRVETALSKTQNREANLEDALRMDGLVENLADRAQRHAAIRQIVRSLKLPGFSWIDWVRAMETIGGDKKDSTGKQGLTHKHADQIPPLDPKEWTAYLITRVHNPNFKGMNPEDAELLFAFMTGLIPLSAISDGIFDYAPGWADEQGVKTTETAGKTISLSHLIRSALFENRLDLAETTLVLALESIRDSDIIGDGLFTWSPDDVAEFKVFGLAHQESNRWLAKARAQAAQSLLALEHNEAIIAKAPHVLDLLRQSKDILSALLNHD